MNELHDANNIYRGALSAQSGSAWKPEVQRFMWNWLLNISELQEELEAHTYQDSKGTEFILRERGHERAIVGKRMRDRVVRHVLCDNILTPETSKRIISANCASQLGKGIDKQRQILVEHLRDYYRRYGNEGYILLIDFSKYYDNVRHDTALSMLGDIVDNLDAMWLAEKIFKGFSVDVSYMDYDEYVNCMGQKFDSIQYREQIPPEARTGEKFMAKSLDIGDQTSQVVSIFYPHMIDNYVKIVRGVKYYGRYMDDSYIIAQAKEDLWDIFDGIKEIAETLGIFINEKKTHIAKLSQGFRFLQVKYALTDTGRVTQRINPKRITAMRRKLKTLARMVDAGERDYLDIENMFKGWMRSHYKLMSRTQIKNMYALYNDLFGARLEWKHGRYYSHPRPDGRGGDQGNHERQQLHNRSGYQYDRSCG